MKNFSIILIIPILFGGCSKNSSTDEFSYSLKVTVSPKEGGSVNPTKGIYQDGVVVRLVGTPNPGYSFKEWNGCLISSQNPLDLAIDSDKLITGVFVKSDMDEDGIIDELDQCDETPLGEEIDEKGCSLSQIDTDGDGITDDRDYCPTTSQGIEVNANGCEISSWEKTFGGGGNDEAYSIARTNDGGYILIGSTTSFGNGNYEVLLIKTDMDGNSEWEKTFGGPVADFGLSVQQANDGGYIFLRLSVSTTGFYYGDLNLVKTDSLGNIQWERPMVFRTNNLFHVLRQTSDQGFIIAGPDFLIKTNSYGYIQWKKSLEFRFSENWVIQTTDGGYLIAGNSYILKTNSEGNFIWEKKFERVEGGFKSVRQTIDGGYIIAGVTRFFANGESDIYLIKTDESGNSIWEKAIGGTGLETGNSVLQTSDGGYMVTGSTTSIGEGKEDVYIIKTDTDGNLLWEKTFGGNGSDTSIDIEFTTDGGFIIAGTTTSFGNGGGDVYLIKFN